MIRIQKVVAYITKGTELLLFEQPDAPDAGIQVPAGTIETGESPDEAVLREAKEETGLTDFHLQTLLGVQERDMADFGKDEIHERYFYHLTCEQETPATWIHDEIDPSTGSSQHIPFRFYWVNLKTHFPTLIADQDAFIPALLKRVQVDNSGS